MLQLSRSSSQSTRQTGCTCYGFEGGGFGLLLVVRAGCPRREGLLLVIGQRLLLREDSLGGDARLQNT